jgi:hypothetical protein
MDWNWFYSSVAQSVAAIVGLFGAFVITKLMTSQGEFKVISSQMTDYVNKAKILEFGIKSRKFSWYNQAIRERELDRIRADMDASRKIRTGNDYFQMCVFSNYDKKEEVMADIDRVILERNSPNRISTLRRLDANSDEVREEEKQIESLLNEILHHNLMIDDLLKTIDEKPQSSVFVNVVIIAIIVLFYLGILLPLAVLPAPSSGDFAFSLTETLRVFTTVKGFYLAGIAVVFTVLMLYFFGVNVSMAFSREKTEKLRYYSSIENYSPYFRNIIENVRRKPAGK